MLFALSTRNIRRIASLACAWLLVACAEIAGVAESGSTVSVAAAVVQADAPASQAAATAELAVQAPVGPASLAEPPPDTSIAVVVQPSLALDAPSASAAEPADQSQTPVQPAEALASSAAVVTAVQGDHNQGGVDRLCAQIGAKLGSVSVEDCLRQHFIFGGGHSVNKRPLVIREFQPAADANGDFRVLIMGGIHGDEYSSISILFKWLALFSPQGLEGEFHWRFAPLVNPDGLLEATAMRQNANGVDLNRNFPSQDWNATAVTYWQESTGSNPRRFPGSSAASEPEVQWVVDQIEAFQPDVIVSVHAPYHLLDFDGPSPAPDKIGELYLHQLGIYPGSLGNFAGLNRRIPVVTLELPSAGIMPPADQISLMWQDLVAWLDREARTGLAN